MLDSENELRITSGKGKMMKIMINIRNNFEVTGLMKLKNFPIALKKILVTEIFIKRRDINALIE